MFATIDQTPLAYLVILAIVVISLYAWYNQLTFQRFRLHPYGVYRGKNLYTLWTSLFVHIHWRHLLVNAFLLFCALPEVEYLLVDDFGPYRGRSWFIVFIMGSAAGAGGLSAIQHRSNPLHWSAGSSALILSAVFFYLLYYPITPIPGMWLMSVTLLPYTMAIVLLLVLLILVWYKDPAGAIHLYGALAGILFVLLVRPAAFCELRDQVPSAPHSEESQNPAPREYHGSGHTDNDFAQDGAFSTGTAFDDLGLISVQALKSPGDLQSGLCARLFFHNRIGFLASLHWEVWQTSVINIYKRLKYKYLI